MGGSGSGSWYRFNKRITVEDCRSLDARRLQVEGLLKPGYRISWSWSRTGRQAASIGGVVLGEHRPEQMVLLFRYRSGLGAEWEDVQQSVEFDWTPCNFGGERPWFICPAVGCGRRVAVLYGPGLYFLCRHCYDFRYESQREDKTHRALRRGHRR